jgi:hypothetical protein
MTERSLYSISATRYGVARLRQPAVPSASAALPALGVPAGQPHRRLVARWCRSDDGHLEMRWASLEPPVA